MTNDNYDKFRIETNVLGKHTGGVPKNFSLRMGDVYNFFNHVLFDNRLTLNCAFDTDDLSEQSFLGTAHPGAQADVAKRLDTARGLCAIGPDETYLLITMSTAYIRNDPFQNVLSTFVHEMCHIEDYLFGGHRTESHTQYWADAMESVGLIPKNIYEQGKKTGQHCSHDIEPNGLFDIASKALMENWEDTDFLNNAWLEPLMEQTQWLRRKANETQAEITKRLKKIESKKHREKTQKELDRAQQLNKFQQEYLSIFERYLSEVKRMQIRRWMYIFACAVLTLLTFHNGWFLVAALVGWILLIRWYSDNFEAAYYSTVPIKIVIQYREEKNRLFDRYPLLDFRDKDINPMTSRADTAMHHPFKKNWPKHFRENFI